MDYEVINNLNLIKIWQLEVAVLATCVKKVHFLEGDSRECLGGDEWWFLVTVGSRRTEERKFTVLPPFKKPSE